MAPASSIPPPLPPSVEEAYRRKCIQLKQRTSEVEEANDAARLRLARLKRQVEKMRLERAFLLEQLAKRTSTNVEDSDGSPSPPPTPKEKPLRVKRGHRKAPILPNLDAPAGSTAAAGAGTPGSTTFISQNLLVHSPSSDAPSAAQAGDAKANGVKDGQPKKPATAFDLYCEDARKDKADLDEEAISSAWKGLPDSKRAEYQARADELLADYEKDKKAAAAAAAASAEAEAAENASKTEDAAKKDTTAGGQDKGDTAESERPAGDDEAAPAAAADEDVEMGNYDTDQETQVDKPDE
ncbi:hypothetical protein VTJ83DRAFT_808 [Remersonia thermophila]|uniref:HMG box domain-containing protein n=1 Tax=Remersonia thermophila TaxID=72144 RepID=A0ABR4DMH5_9PEZI